jgi:predicted CXXCH cytochrome family protein
MKRQIRRFDVGEPGDTAISFRLQKPLVLLLFSVFAIFMFAGVLFFTEIISAQKKNSCNECHSRMDGQLGQPSKLFENDIHRARGLSCNDCHGGDPSKDDKTEAKSPYSGYLGTPKPAEVPAFCGKCHSDASVMKRFNPSLRVDQVQEYASSVHGKRLKEGDQNVATCISCHGIHGIRATTDSLSLVNPVNVAETCAKCHANADYMKDYAISHDQYDKYKTSVHYKALYEKHDLSAPTCNDCHGNHGAVPPGVTSVANVCGQCHSRQSELFQKSPHKNAFDSKQIGECVQCHNNHGIAAPTDDMVGVGKGSVCISCHKNDKGFAAAKQMHETIIGFQRSVHSATELLEQAERMGMEVSRPKFELEDALGGLTQARVLIHGASADEVKKAIAPGMVIAANSYKQGQDAFVELNFRRKGLAVSLVFILILAALVYLKLRQIEGNDRVAADEQS